MLEGIGVITLCALLLAAVWLVSAYFSCRYSKFSLRQKQLYAQQAIVWILLAIAGLQIYQVHAKANLTINMLHDPANAVTDCSQGILRSSSPNGTYYCFSR